MKEIKAAVLKNIYDNLKDQIGDATYYYSSSGLDLSDKTSTFEDRLEKLDPLIHLFTEEYQHKVQVYSDAKEMKTSPLIWQHHSALSCCCSMFCGGACNRTTICMANNRQNVAERESINMWQVLSEESIELFFEWARCWYHVPRCVLFYHDSSFHSFKHIPTGEKLFQTGNDLCTQMESHYS